MPVEQAGLQSPSRCRLPSSPCGGTSLAPDEGSPSEGHEVDSRPSIRGEQVPLPHLSVSARLWSRSHR